jgi:hypothetical protein
MNSTHCKNCNALAEGNYCSVCGQATSTHAINASYFLHDIPHSIFHVDKGLFYTLKALFTNPGKMLVEYLEGKRVKHFRPFAYVVIMSTLCTLLIKGIEAVMIRIYTSKNPEAVINVHHSFFHDYISVLIFLLIPVLSLITWLCMIRKPFNYWEHFLINTYLSAQLNIILLLIKIYGLIKLSMTGEFSGVNFTFFMIIFMFYYAVAFSYLGRPFTKKWKGALTISLMNFLLASAYMTAFSLAGIMAPWWNVK